MSKKKEEKELEVKENGKEIINIFRSKARECPITETDLKALKKQLASFEEFKLPPEKIFTNIKKLKCDYTTYKKERTKYNMPVETNCAKCGKRFEAGEDLYTAFEEGKQGSQIICGNCAMGE